MMFSTKLRGKFMSKQIKPLKDINDRKTNITASSIETTVRVLKKSSQEI